MAQESVLTAENWFDNPLQPGWVTREVILPKAIAGSLFLHGFVFLILMFVSLLPDADSDAPPAVRDEGILITLVRRSDSADNETGNISVAPVPQEVTQPDTAIPDSGPDIAETETTAVVPVSETEMDTGEEGIVTGRAETLALVSTAIAGFRDSRQVELHREYVEGCIRRRNRYGQNSECPDSFDNDYRNSSEERALVDELFAVLNNDQVNARHSWRLTRENAMLKELLENVDNPVAAQAVTTRLALNTQYLQYLNGNISPDVAAYNVMTGFTNDYGRTITPRPYQFDCGLFKPCVYKFTGFTVKRPANYVEKAPSFPEQTPLFMPSQD